MMTKNQKGLIVLISGILIGLSYLLKNIGLNAIYSNTLLILATLMAEYTIFKSAITSLRYKIIGIEALVTVAVTGALIIGEYFEGAAVTFLFMLGSYLEAKTLEKTRSALKELMDLRPTKATVVRKGTEIEVPSDEVEVGETVIVKPGGKVPVDGVITKGKASINQAAMTGESVPIRKSSGDQVFNGTVIESGFLEVQAEKVGDDTSFARIIELVEEAQDSKAKTQKFIERFAKYYTPGIMILSIMVFMITSDIKLTLTLLVIACPGALVISTPVSIVAGIGNAARNGILIKGGEYLEKANLIEIVAFDKTGTLTIGHPVVTSIINLSIDQKELLTIAASIEQSSEHHLAKAIIEKAKTENITLNPVNDFEAFSGKGVRGNINNQNYYIGNTKFMSDFQIMIPEDLVLRIREEESKGQTVLMVSNDTKILGIFTIADDIRKDAKDIVSRLKQQGIKKVIMLTGDNTFVANSVGEQLKIDEVYAELLPEDKLKLLNRLQENHQVAMIGDGINDAPSLATADLGISMGDVGTDVAIETADIILLSDQLIKLSLLYDLSHATSRNLKQNLFFALFVVFSLIIGVLLGKVFMSLGMLVHELSVIAVILNAVRLNRYKKKSK